MRRFQKIDVTEPTVKETIEILKGLSGKFEEHHSVVYKDSAIVAAVELSDRFISDKNFLIRPSMLSMKPVQEKDCIRTARAILLPRRILRKSLQRWRGCLPRPFLRTTRID